MKKGGKEKKMGKDGEEWQRGRKEEMTKIDQWDDEERM